MISYDSYKNRIEKVARVKAVILRFKFLIIGVLAVIIAGVTALLATKGMVTSAMVLPAEITYGDEYSPTAATAFLSGITYEYSVQGTDEWSEEKPLKVGKYFARTVTDKAIGKGYGEPVGFEILPKAAEFVLNDTQMTYGTAPSKYSLNGIVDGDRIRTVDFIYDYHDTEEYDDWSVDVSVGAGGVRVVNKNGEDMSDCYTYEALTKSIALRRRAISVQMKPATSVYTGAPVNYSPELEEVSKNSLANGDEMVFETEEVSLLNATTYTIRITSAKIFNNGVDVTHRYVVPENISATFTVTPKPVTVVTDGATKVYDGAALSATGGRAEGLVSGHKIEFTTPAPEYINADSYLNIRSYKITDANGDDVTSNYAAVGNESWGKLIIEKRAITVELNDLTSVYGDVANYALGFANNYKNIASESKLVTGETLTVTYVSYGTTALSDVNAYNAVSSNCYATVSKPDGDSTGNYKIDFIGTLTVTRRPLNITLNDITATYGDNITYSAGNEVNDNIVRGQSVSVNPSDVRFGFTKSIPDVADYDITCTAAAIRILSGSTDVTSNYDINTPEKGTLTVTRRHVTVTLNDIAATYGDDITYRAGNEAENNIVGGQSVKVDASAVDLGFAPQTIPDVNYYFITCDPAAVTVSDGSANVTSNYVITTVNGVLTVNKKSLSVTLSDITATYGDEAVYSVSASNYKTQSGLLTGEVLTVLKADLPYFDAGVHTFGAQGTSDYYKVVKADGSDSTGNYAFTAQGEVTVTPREVTVKLSDMSAVYGDNIAFSVYGGNYEDITSGSLRAGERLTVKKVDFGFGNTAIPDVDDYSLSARDNDRAYFSVQKTDGSDGTANYRVSFEDGTLTIEKRNVTVRLNSFSVTYGNAIDYPAGSEAAYNLVSGHALRVLNVSYAYGQPTVPPDIGYYYIAATPDDIEIRNGSTAVTFNYNISVDYGYLTINTRPLTVTTSDMRLYYGDELEYEKAEGNYKSVSGLVSGEKLTVTYVSFTYPSYKTYPDAGEYKINGKSCAIYKTDGSPSTRNYSISYERSSLLILKRQITVSLGSATTVYGEALPAPDSLEIGGQGLAYSDTFDPVFLYLKNGAAPAHYDAGDYAVTLDTLKSSFVYSNGSASTVQNYDITEVKNGNLTINKRTLTIALINQYFTYGTISNVVNELYWTYKGSSALSYLNNPISSVMGVEGFAAGESFRDLTFKVLDSQDKPCIPRNSGVYWLELSGYVINYSDETAQTAENYELEFANREDGRTFLTIWKKNVSVTINGLSVTYGDYDYALDAYNVEAGNCSATLAFEEKLQLSDFALTGGADGYRLNAGEYSFTANTTTVFDNYGNPIEGGGNNYVFNFVNDGKLTVAQKSVTLELPDVAPVTYGETFNVPQTTLTGGFAYGQRLELSVTFENSSGGFEKSPKNAGDYLIRFDYAVYGENCDSKLLNTDGSPAGFANYIYGIAEDKTATIKPFEIYHTVPDDEIVYGEEIKHKSGVYYTNSDYTLPYDEIAMISYKYTDLTQTNIIENPAEVGEYIKKVDRFRAFGSDSSFTNYKVIETDGTLSIYPRKITVTLNDILDIEYGNAIVYHTGTENTENLLPGHVVSVDSSMIDYVSDDSVYPEVGTYAITCPVGAISVLIKYAYPYQDVTRNYSITIIDGTLEIIKRQVAVSPVCNNKTYDGEAAVVEGFDDWHYGYDVSTDGFVYGDEANYAFAYTFFNSVGNEIPAPVNAGSYQVAVTVPEEDKNYVFHAETTYFTIEKRHIVVITGSLREEYDGKAHSSKEYSTYLYGDYSAPGLLNGDTLEVIDGSVTSIINVGLRYNNMEFNCGYNYQIVDYDWGRLEIYQRKITISLLDIIDREYDGTEQTYGEDGKTYELLSGAVVDGEILTVRVMFSDVPINAGEYTYRFDFGASEVSGSLGGLDNGITNYYIVCTDTKSFEITKRALSIVLNPISDCEYDGDAHEYEKGGEVITGLVDGNLYISVEYLNGEKSPISGFPVDAGTYFIKLDTESSYAGGYTLDTNYKVDCAEISFTISPKKLTIIMGDESRVYNGEEYDYPNENANFTADTVWGETVVPDVDYSGAPRNAGVYIVTFDSFTVEGGRGLISNYTVSESSVLSCTLEIEKLKVTPTVYSRSIERPENLETPLEDEEFDINAFLAVDRDKVEYTFNYTFGGEPVDNVYKLGEYVVSLEVTGNDEILNNYDIQPIDGSLEITARQVTVIPVCADKVYDGKPLGLDDISYVHYHTVPPEGLGFVNGDEENFTFTYTFDNKAGFYPVNAGTYTLRVTVTGYDENDYEVECLPINVTIEKRPVSVGVVLGSEFDNLCYSHSALPDTVTFEELDLGYENSGRLPQDTINYSYELSNELYDAVTLCYAGNYTAFASGLDNDNYVIVSPRPSYFYVKRQTLYVKPNDKSALYAEKNQVIALDNSDFTVLYGAIIGGDVIDITYSTVLTAPTPLSRVTITNVQFAYSGLNVTACYDLHYTYSAGDAMVGESWYNSSAFSATLSFEKREVHYTQISPDIREFKYDGGLHALTKDGAEITVNTPDLFRIVSGGDGFVGGDTAVAITLKPVVTVGSYENWVVLMVKNADGKVATPLYNLVLDNAEDSEIVVVGDLINVDFDSGLDLDAELASGESEYLSASQYSGYYVLSESCYSLNCENSGTNKVEVLVSESGEVKIIVFEEVDGKRTEKSITYSLGAVTGIDREVKLVQIYTLLLGKTTN